MSTSASSFLSPSTATLEALEFPQFLAVLAQLAATDLGQERIRSLLPFADEDGLRHRRGAVEEAERLLRGGRLVPSFEESLGAILDRLASGRPPIGGPELVLLATLLRATGDARLRILEAEPSCPTLGEQAQELTDLRDLQGRILRSLDPRGNVREDASPALRRLRGRIQKLRDGLYKELRGYVDNHRDELSEETVPMRDGRLVLTLQSNSKGRLQGLTHGRSSSGKSFYFEPLQVVESNNQLQQTVEDEAAEKQRILNELVDSCREALPEIHAHGSFLADLDLLQAAHGFAQRCEGRLPDLAPRHELKLLQARHPLLDSRLADLRLLALGHSGFQGQVVPLDVEFSSEHRILVVTGPNAGGKTVSLKTTGLLTLVGLCGLPIPVAAGSRLPLLDGLVATVGDEQDLLADRSTFSGRLLRLKEAWETAGPASLILLDELGSGTDPTEGAALAVSLLEALLERSSLALMTSHLVQVAAAAMELPGASCAAMDFDSQTGSPTFRLVPGPPGGSEALALARRLGLPEAWLERAESRLGPEHRDLRRLIAEVEALREGLREERGVLAQEIADATILRERLAEREADLRQERKNLSKQLRGQLDDFRREARGKLREEILRLRQNAAESRSRGVEKKVSERIFSEAPRFEAGLEEEFPEGPVEVGATVRHRTFGWQGVLEKLDRGKAEVRVQGKHLRCREEELAPAQATPKAKAPRTKPGISHGGGFDVDSDLAAARELNLIGSRVEPALEQLDSFLDQALLTAAQEVRVIHGHGSGRLRSAVRDHLKRHPAVSAFRPGGEREGGNGATVANLG